MLERRPGPVVGRDVGGEVGACRVTPSLAAGGFGDHAAGASPAVGEGFEDSGILPPRAMGGDGLF